MSNSVGLKKRNSALDIVRVVAISLVIMIHTSAPFVVDYDIGSFEFIWGNIFDTISHIGVPLFLMTSGALLLNEEYSFDIKGLFTKRIPQIIFLLIFWSVLYAVIYKLVIPFINNEVIDIKKFIETLIMGYYHLWYLYMLVGIYLALPFLRAFVCKKNKNLILLYIAIALVFRFSIPVLSAVKESFLGSAHSLIVFLNQFKMDFFFGYIAYYLAGWYIVNVGIPQKIKEHHIYIWYFNHFHYHYDTVR